METELLALHWMEHASVFSRAVGNLRTKTSYTDATLACDGHFYPVHKFVLSTCSQYFNAIFEWTPCINPVVVINNVTYKELEALLDFMYTGEVSVKDSLIPDIMQAAECLKIRGLSLHDDDVTKSKANKDPIEPARKRRRTTATKRKCSTYMNIPSTSYMSESNHNSCVSPSLSVPSYQMNNDEALNHTETPTPEPEPEYTPPHRTKTPEYDTNMTHAVAAASSQNNASSTFVQAPIPSPPPSETVQQQQQQPPKRFHSPPPSPLPTKAMISAQINTLPPPPPPPHVPAPSRSNALSLSPEPTPIMSMHSVITMRPDKIEIVERKVDSPEDHNPVTKQENPEFDDMDDDDDDDLPLSHVVDKSEPRSEDANIGVEDTSENMFNYSENFASPSTSSSAATAATATGSVSHEQSRRKKKEPGTSGGSKKKKQVPKNTSEVKSETPGVKCPTCGKEFKKKDSLTRHIRTHSKEPYTCTFCPFTTTSYKASLDHRKKEHASCRKCTLCDFTCQNNDELRQHLAAHEKIHKCTKCKFSTARPDNLEKHITRKHEKK